MSDETMAGGDMPPVDGPTLGDDAPTGLGALTFPQLRAEAKRLGVSGGGTREELVERLAAIRDELAGHDLAELVDLAEAHDVDVAGLAHDDVVEMLMLGGVRWHTGDPQAAATSDNPVTIASLPGTANRATFEVTVSDGLVYSKVAESATVFGVKMDSTNAAEPEPEHGPHDTPDGTIWIGRFHVDIESPAYRALTT